MRRQDWGHCLVIAVKKHMTYLPSIPAKQLCPNPLVTNVGGVYENYLGGN